MERMKYRGTAGKPGGNRENKPQPKTMGASGLLKKHKGKTSYLVLVGVIFIAIAGCEDDSDSFLRVNPSRNSYAAADRIEFEIANNTESSVQIQFCSATGELQSSLLSYSVEKEEGDSWELTYYSPQIVTLEIDMLFELESESVWDGFSVDCERAMNGHGPGTYRLVVFYQADEKIDMDPNVDCETDSPSSDLSPLCSKPFTISSN